MQAQFQKMGARVEVHERNIGRSLPLGPKFIRTVSTSLPGLRVNVVRGLFTVDKSVETTLRVLDLKVKDRHLLLMAQVGQRHQKFLCGHDERDWFVAAVPDRVISVTEAKDSLRPKEVGEALLKAGVPARKRHKRHNKAYTRQGEWFFVPAPDENPNPLLILKNEPLQRADRRGGKPHIVQELFRRGGTAVWVHPTLAPQGVNEKEYKKLLKQNSVGWRPMMLNPSAFARGTVRHQDHATVRLTGWHHIYMNSEVRGSSLGFLD